MLNRCGWFHQGHRAFEDCHALLEALAHPISDSGGSPLTHLLRAADRSLVRIWAEGSPFDTKDVLKKRGYRWNDGTNGQPKSWWTEVDEGSLQAELAFLRAEIYRRDVEPLTQKLSALERFRAF